MKLSYEDSRLLWEGGKKDLNIDQVFITQGMLAFKFCTYSEASCGKSQNGCFLSVQLLCFPNNLVQNNIGPKDFHIINFHIRNFPNVIICSCSDELYSPTNLCDILHLFLFLLFHKEEKAYVQSEGPAARLLPKPWMLKTTFKKTHI